MRFWTIWQPLCGSLVDGTGCPNGHCRICEEDVKVLVGRHARALVLLVVVVDPTVNMLSRGSHVRGSCLSIRFAPSGKHILVVFCRVLYLVPVDRSLTG